MPRNNRSGWTTLLHACLACVILLASLAHAADMTKTLHVQIKKSETGIDPDSFVAGPRFNEALAALMQRLLNSAEALYVRSDVGLARLPAGCRPGMSAARLMYAEIGHELARRGFDSVTQRTVVPWPRKARILADALLLSRRPAFGDRVVWLVELFEKLERFDRSENRVSANGSM